MRDNVSTTDAAGERAVPVQGEGGKGEPHFQIWADDGMLRSSRCNNGGGSH